MALWQDLKALTRSDFEATLDELAGKPKPTPRTRRVRPSQPKDDRPVTRIAHQLRERASLSDEVAVAKLSEALMSRGIREELIPPRSTKPLEAWLSLLISQVSEGTVMATAKRLKT